MDQLIGKAVASHLQDIALAILISSGIIAVAAQRRLANYLKRNENVGWKMVDIPDFSHRESLRAEMAFTWSILAPNYRHSENTKIRLLADLILVCIVTMWTIALAVIVFGDLGRYDFVFHYGS
jgi:hypothetical protein